MINKFMQDLSVGLCCFFLSDELRESWLITENKSLICCGFTFWVSFPHAGRYFDGAQKTFHPFIIAFKFEPFLNKEII